MGQARLCERRPTILRAIGKKTFSGGPALTRRSAGPLLRTCLQKGRIMVGRRPEAGLVPPYIRRAAISKSFTALRFGAFPADDRNPRLKPGAPSGVPPGLKSSRVGQARLCERRPTILRAISKKTFSGGPALTRRSAGPLLRTCLQKGRIMVGRRPEAGLVPPYIRRAAISKSFTALPFGAFTGG